jgi:hypothetical protein
LLVAGVVAMVLGYALVLASGYGGNSSGGSEVVWRIGGVMVEVGGPLLVIAALIHVVRLVGRAAVRRRGVTL